MGEKGIMTPLMVSQMVIVSELPGKRDHGAVNGIINGYYWLSGYIAPHRMAYDLTERQREILHILSKKPSLPLREIRAAMDNPPSDRRLREEFLHLKKLGLVSSSGHGHGASWALRRHDVE